MDHKPVRLPSVLRKIPPLPQVLVRAMDLINDPNSQRSELARVLSLDQGMTGMFLQMVNSAYYALPRRITSLEEAIGYLGYETVHEAIMAVSVNKLLSSPVPAYMLERTMLWKHSVAVACGGDIIAHKRHINPPSEVYVAGLLHDVGKIAMDMIVEHRDQWERGDKALIEAESEEETLAWTEIEHQLTGHDHADISAVIARSWNLPDRVVEAIAYHHAPSKAKLDPQFTAAIHIADIIALMSGIGLGVDGLRYTADEAAFTILNWQEKDMEDLLVEVQEEVSQAEASLGIN